MIVVTDTESAGSPHPLVVIVGPTASGKTALSIALAQEVDGEIVNADSVLTYRGMDIGSAKPSVDERSDVPHHLIDMWEIDHDATVAEFQELARAAIKDVTRRQKIPILVGGSALYIRAVIDALDFPGTDRHLRAKWQAKAEEIGPEALHRLLAERDPVAANMILATNHRRVVRALEVIELTGQPFKASLPAYESIYPRLLMIGLKIDREILDQRIEQRVDDMWGAGLIDEVQRLPDLAGSPTASRAIGYQQVLTFLAGECDENQAREDTITGTKKLARRQDRMLHKDPRTIWFDYDDPQLLDKVVSRVKSSMDNVG